jgi:RNA polymerase sigma-70 factor (ECF subfamily)
MSNEGEEARWVERAREGDPEAFWQLVEQHGPMVRRVLMRLVKDRERVDDLFSDTFVKAADKITRFRGESAFSTWLISIALNLARNELRKEKRRQTIAWDDVIPREAHAHGVGAPALTEWRNPHDVLEAKELRDLLDQALQQLPHRYRVVFTLRDIEGLTTDETAKLLGLSHTAVKSRAVRARLALRKYLTPYFGSPREAVSRA